MIVYKSDGLDVKVSLEYESIRKKGGCREVLETEMEGWLIYQSSLRC